MKTSSRLKVFESVVQNTIYSILHIFCHKEKISFSWLTLKIVEGFLNENWCWEFSSMLLFV